MKRHYHQRHDSNIVATYDDFAGLASGLGTIVGQFDGDTCRLNDHAICRQIGLLRAELDKLERQVKHDLHEAA